MNFKFTKAEFKAKTVLEECGLDMPTQLLLEEIVLGRGAYYEEKSLEFKEGEIVSFGDRSIITINSNIQYQTKKRFAIAHELGHFEMHKNLSPIITDTEYDLVNWYQAGPQEAEANEFAAEFLMPSNLFHSECEEYYFDPSLITHLANMFEVSKTAALLRFVKRGNHPVCVIYCKNNKMKWFKASYDWKYFLEFERDKHPPTDSVAYELFTSKRVYAQNELKQEIWKSTWLRHNPEYGDPKFYEFCLFVPSYNYSLSIIWED
ncbi:ImmA/IrrE family metallo-endopeptidase [uncultured Algoriphagus sp.]|uniref:ImmA/IrrE family metallo-endopeptidase n=1 Tax=uncultured Algoriphagus sp. TaxID=417365 RepID=UPI0030ED634B|tara:strand:+ start:36541 stop:37326 length:786 start_codon:yes stop_codon:yes gene_type:complete